MNHGHGSISPLDVLVRKEFLYDLRAHKGEYISGEVFGAISVKNWAPLFSVMLENGVQFTRLPLHAFVWKEGAPEIPLDFLILWDCFDYSFSYHQFDLLKEMRCRVFAKNGEIWHGEYVGTFDWFHDDPQVPDVGYSQVPEGHKQGHLIRLDNGCFAIQPNNRIYWANSDFIFNPLKDDERPDYLIHTHKWSVEGVNPRWVTEDSDAYMYGYRDTGIGKKDDEVKGRTAAQVRAHKGKDFDAPTK